MISASIILLGIAIFALAIGVSINTSMGGTRSDYTDSSGCLFTLGAFVAFVGLAHLVTEILP